MKRLVAFAAAVAIVFFTTGQATAGPLGSVLIRDVPHVMQKPDFCGEACAEMYYHAFHKNAATDRTGYKTLRSILEEDDADAFRKRWEKLVLELRFRD
ncbi:MAG: hypothetical protein HY290_10910 [Planctomycetia bacterium]|nr:hypothetical protein [Planctomycetia bacterium]